MQMKKIVVGCAAGLGMCCAFADGTIDTSAITAAGVSVTAVGLAVFGVRVGAKMYQWIRAAL